MEDEHYLKSELYRLVATDPEIFDFIQSASLDGLWYWDIDNPEHEWMNPRFWEVLGYDPSKRKHLAAEWQDLIHPDDLQMALKSFQDHCADPSCPYDQVVRYQHADGSTVWVRCRGMAVRDADGRPFRMLGAHTDVTAFRREEERNLALVRELTETNQTLEAFCYSVAHDLKSPLRNMRMFGQLLSKNYGEQLPSEAQEFVQFIQDSSAQMWNLVDSLLQLFRLQEPSDADMEFAMDDLVKDVIGRIDAEGVEIAVEGPLPIIRGNPTLLRQVWENLLGNAVRYRRRDAESWVRITSTIAETEISFVVQDNGVGFSPGLETQLFQPFFRADVVQTDGAGVGLAIVKRIVDRQGGRVWASSDDDMGAKFGFSLPLSALASASDRAPFVF